MLRKSMVTLMIAAAVLLGLTSEPAVRAADTLPQ